MKNVIHNLHHHECMDVVRINSLTAPVVNSNLAKKFALRICGRFPYECLLLSSLSM